MGGALLVHNIAKMQDYNTIINAYPSLGGIGGATWYILLSFIEVICAFMLIMGYYVRLAAIALILGTISVMTLYFKNGSPLFIEMQAINVFIYIFFIFTGGGLYSIDKK